MVGDRMTDWFLNLFDPDPFEAQRKCEALRSKLIFYFQHRMIAKAEDRAQEVLLRVLRKSPGGVVTHLDLVRYCYGVARNIIKEVGRERPMEELPSELDRKTYTSNSGPNQEDELLMTERADLIRTCLKSLPPADLQLLMSWYLGEKDSHKKLASDLGISPNALRIRIHRLAPRVQEMFRQKGLR
jgi:RNA polymerase sigma factor (sigma-70 family)